MADQREDQDLPVTWAHSIGTRDGTLTTDALMVNCFVEKTDNGGAIVKRPGTQYVSVAVGTVPVAQGQFAFLNKQYYIVNDNIYPSGNTGAAVPIPIVSLTVAGSPYFFISTVQAGAPNTILENAIGELWTFNGTVTVKVTDANYISAQVAPGMAYLDGVYYAMRLNGQVIGSAINDPTTWPALDFAQADVTYGGGISLQRHLNYILAFYEKGLQVYWDANAAPNTQGIALLPVLSASFRTGCFSAQSIVELQDICLFMSLSTQSGVQIQMMQGLQLQVVSTPFVEKILNNTNLEKTSPGIWSFGIITQGHQFYVLTLTPLNVTLVCDITMNTWETWSSVVGGVEQFFTGRFYLSGNDQSGLPVLDGDLLQDIETGRQMQMVGNVFVDATGPINVTAITPPYDWNTSNWKRFNQMAQLADSINTTIGVSFSDDDYQTFSSPRDIDLNGPRNQLRRCGESRRRIWKMFHQDNTPLRLYEMRMDMDIMNR